MVSTVKLYLFQFLYNFVSLEFCFSIISMLKSEYGNMNLSLLVDAPKAQAMHRKLSSKTIRQLNFGEGQKAYLKARWVEGEQIVVYRDNMSPSMELYKSIIHYYGSVQSRQGRNTTAGLYDNVFFKTSFRKKNLLVTNWVSLYFI